MKDKAFLEWIHARLEFIHGENPAVDYMHNLRAIIEATPEDQETPNTCVLNCLPYFDRLQLQDGDIVLLKGINITMEGIEKIKHYVKTNLGLSNVALINVPENGSISTLSEADFDRLGYVKKTTVEQSA